MSIFHQIIPDVQTAGMAWSQHNRNDSEYLHPFGRKQQAVFCQCHHRNPTRNVKISEQKNCSEIKKMVPLTGLEPVLWKPERDFKSRVSTNSTIAAYSIPPMEGYEVGGMCWRDVPTQRKIKLKKLAVCKHNSDWVLHPAHGILSPRCLPFHHSGGCLSTVWNIAHFFASVKRDPAAL